jgi:hypothetical protein
MHPVLHRFGALAPFGLVLSHRLTSSLFKAVLFARTAIYLAQKCVFRGGLSGSFDAVKCFDHLRFAPGELSPLEHFEQARFWQSHDAHSVVRPAFPRRMYEAAPAPAQEIREHLDLFVGPIFAP